MKNKNTLIRIGRTAMAHTLALMVFSLILFPYASNISFAKCVTTIDGRVIDDGSGGGCVNTSGTTITTGSSGTSLTGASTGGTSLTGATTGTTLTGANTSGKFTNPIQASSLSGLLTSVLKVVIELGAVVVVFFYIWAGFKYVTARGDPGKISEATTTLTWTTVGAMVILGAQVIATAISGTVNELNLTK